MNIKSIILVVILGLFSMTSFADVSVNGYYRKDGTYVQPHDRSSPNNSTHDNWSTKGNINPYTGEKGTRDPNYNSYQNR